MKFKHKDESILRLFNNSIKNNFFDHLMPIITYLGSTYFVIGYCLTLFIIPSNKGRSLALKSFIALTMSFLISQIIKKSVKRIRPFVALKNLNIKLIEIDKYSFPSGHTTSAFTLGVMASLYFPHMLILFLSLSTLVGISRMYLGVHYPTDIIAGSILGTLCSLIVYMV